MQSPKAKSGPGPMCRVFSSLGVVSELALRGLVILYSLLYMRDPVVTTRASSPVEKIVYMESFTVP